MPLTPFYAGQRLTAAALNAALDIVQTKYQIADQSTISNITPISSTYLTIPVVANAGYSYDACIIYDTSATADFRINLSLPAGASVRHTAWCQLSGLSTIDAAIAHDALDAASMSSVGGVAAGTMMTMRPTGHITIGVTAGNVVLQFAQGTSTGVTTYLKLGSWLRLVRVA